MPRLPLHKVLSWVGSDKEKPDSHSASSETAHFRRSSRIPHSIVLSLSGQEENGKAFEARAQTLDVCKHGAKIVTPQQLAPDTTLTLANLATGHTGLARVIWRARSSSHGFETGVEVVEPADPELIWEVESPPADWAEGCAAPTADERLEFLCHRARSDHSTVESSFKTDNIPPSASPADVADFGVTSDADTATSESSGGLSFESPASVETFESSAEKASSTPKPSRQWARGKPKVTLLALNLGNAARASAKLPASEPEQSAKEAEPTLADSVVSEQEVAKSQEVQTEGPSGDSIGNNGHSAAAVLPSAEFPALDPAADTASPHYESTADQAQPGPSEAPEAGPEIHPRPIDTATLEKLSSALRASGEEVVGQVREQLAHMTFKSLEILTQKAKTLSDDCQSRLTKALDKTVSRSQDSVASTIRRASEQAVTDIESSQQKMEAGFETRAAEYERRLEELSTSAAQGLEQRSDAMMERFQGHLENALADFEQGAVKRLQALVERLTAQFEQNWAEQAEKQAASMGEKLGERLRLAGGAVVEETKSGLADVTKASLEAVTQATARECHSQLDRIFREQSELVSGAADEALGSIKLAADQGQSQLRVVRQEMGGSFETSAHEAEKRLATQISRGTESLDHKSRTILEEFEIRLGNSLRRVEEKAGKELSAALEKVAVKKSEDAARHFELHAAEAERKLKEGLTASGESVVEEARRLAGVTHSALESLTQTAAEECRRKLEDFRTQTGSTHRQMDEISKRVPQVHFSEAAPSRRAQRSRGSGFAVTLVLLLVLVPVGVVVYLSTRPVMRLRTEPPAGFVDSNPKWNAKRAAAEDQVGRAYWDAAVQNVQPIYHYGTSLPATPPVSFQVDPETLAASGIKVDATAERAHYWQKLRELWDQQATWEQSFGWNTDWINNLGPHGDSATAKPARAKDTGAASDPNP